MTQKLHNLTEVFLLYDFIFAISTICYRLLIYLLFNNAAPGPEAIILIIPIIFVFIPGSILLALVFFLWAVSSKKDFHFFPNHRFLFTLSLLFTAGYILFLIYANVSPMINAKTLNSALDTNDASLCQNILYVPGTIPGFDRKEECLTKVAAKTKNVSLCPDSGSQQSKWCLHYVESIRSAKPSDAITVCSALSGEVLNYDFHFDSSDCFRDINSH